MRHEVNLKDNVVLVLSFYDRRIPFLVWVLNAGQFSPHHRIR